MTAWLEYGLQSRYRAIVYLDARLKRLVTPTP